MVKYIFVFMMLLGFVSNYMAQDITGEEILKKIDANLVIDQALSTTTMIIHGRAGTRTIKSKTLTNEDKSFVEYLSPPREKGKKMLRLDDKLWNYVPEPTDRIITISGHLLKQSVMGSDFSYEDVTENRKLYEMYDAKIVGSEKYEDSNCYVLELTAKESDITYYSRKIWVDKARWLPLKEERFAKSGKLIKRTEIKDIFFVDGRWYPQKMTFKDMLLTGEGTEYIIDSIDFNVNISEYQFTKAALRK